MIERRLHRLWRQLQGRQPHVPHFLSEIHLSGIRGIEDLRIKLNYPVSVVAGANGSGKSTLLFAAASAYKVPGAGVRDFVPSTLFPDYRPKQGKHCDERGKAKIQFEYSTPDGHMTMCWKRGKGWNRSFLGRRLARQPMRDVYLRTLSNISNPSEVRGVLSMSRLRSAVRETPLTASQVEFAQRILAFRYNRVVNLSSGKKSLLFAEQDRGVTYSELHMAAGERIVLRLSQEIAQLEGALVLIDEVEASLHPWVQQLLMLQLQDVALRNDLQVIVTTHSKSILDSVPEPGRIFLDRRHDGRVEVCPPYRDIVQSALYGHLRSALNLLCEDTTAEGILRGVLDVLLSKEGINNEAIQIGRNTGAEEFPTHAAAFSKFGQIDHFVFILDGDKRGTGLKGKIRSAAGSSVPVVFLPGQSAPESWVWTLIVERCADLAPRLGIGVEQLKDLLVRIGAIYDSVSDRPSAIAKAKLDELAHQLDQTSGQLCRLIARADANSRPSELRPLMEAIHRALLQWRQGSSAAQLAVPWW